jgi:PAS domain S-box-containing protein
MNNNNFHEIVNLLNNTSECIHRLESDGTISWVNAAWKKTLGLTDKECLGKSIQDYLSNESKLKFAEIFPRLNNGESIENISCVFLSSNNESIYLEGSTKPILEEGIVVGSRAFFQDVTVQRKALRELRQMTNLQDILMRIATHYINVPINDLNQIVYNSLGDIASFASADRAYIFRYDFKNKLCKNTYEWCDEGINPQINDLQSIALSDMPFWLSKHKKGECVEIEDIELLEGQGIKSRLKLEGIKSLITLPLMDEGNVLGFVGFDLIRNKRTFSNDEKNVLKLFAQMLVNVHNRLLNAMQIEKTKQELQQMNESLEQQVSEKTKRNISLSKNIIEQEKMATIGEISAGIAHDLNTPLSTIKVGADNIKSIIETLFTKQITLLSANELTGILERIQTSQIEMYVGGSQLRREKTEMFQYLSENYQLESAELEKIADLLVKSRVNKEDSFFIQYILELKNRIQNLEVLYQLQMAYSQLATIKNSSDKAVKVVQDVRAFIKGETQQEKHLFNLKSNISTVLGIFNYELKKEVDLQFNIDESIELYGFEIKLFQVWSNLVKNALEAMEDQEQRYLGISTEKTNTTLTVVFENNGPQIPSDVIENMFKKFYTTKGRKSGSGLGLSIVKNVLDEHDAVLNVVSDDNRTKFIITFKI